MGGFEILVIPLVALVIWVLQYLFRNKQENQNKDRGRSDRPRRDPDRGDDLRREQERERDRNQGTRRPVPPAQRRPSPGRPVLARPQEPLPTLDLAPEEKSGSLEKRLETREARRAPAPTVTAPTGVPAVTAAPPPAAEARRAPIALPTAPRRNSTLPELGRILRSPASIRAAFVLNEVLGPPLSRRPRRPLDRPL